MALFPETQSIAQAELDGVVGSSRLPTMEDRASLPYVVALIKETLRWHAVVPLSVPRRTDKDDAYNGSYQRRWMVVDPKRSHVSGYFIPAGTTVMPNIWYVAVSITYTSSSFSQQVKHTQVHGF